MFDVQGGAEPVKLVPARRGTLAQAEQTVGEFLAVVGENGADAQRAGAFQIT